jgi:hypothetical protein
MKIEKINKKDTAEEISRKDAIKKIGSFGKYAALTALGTYAILSPLQAQFSSGSNSNGMPIDPGTGFL